MQDKLINTPTRLIVETLIALLLLAMMACILGGTYS